ncbi:ralBP1-associated Eps domain-containing protein 2 isoform X1 [Anguilla anguilla]|uniref:ralBP1-associated Eps domain-containing protein 2 isoform X1 n=2 Tax=Anguilla anguilla TaxID=7936 RepID=UPI0015AAFEEA|nr:ralBP1-associated Eps domain-containing protein 2 isoform X1 [Anguilla anguilla]
MDLGPGTATAGSFISLSENEQRCYSGLCTLCQADSPGKLAASKVGELFRASQLPAETLHQITELCGAKRLGYFGTGQFYVALKLLAAAQSGLPVRLESIQSELPLPRFSGMQNEAEVLFPNHAQNSDAPAHQYGATPGLAGRVTADRSNLRHPESSAEKQEPRSPSLSPISSPPGSPSIYHSYAHGAQRNGTEALAGQLPRGPGWPLAQPEGSSPSHYGGKPFQEQPTLPRASSVERLVEHSAEDYPDNPWRITEEQREYYTNQFKTLQPDLGALILGSIAKNFFTKSKLPIPELSHIWELSDVDRDGALTFAEFCTAFHLIVARKNGYPLPETLPPTLLPGFVEQDGVPQALLGEETFYRVSQHPVEPAAAERAEPLISFEETELAPTQQEKSTVETQAPLAEVTTSKQELREEPSASAFSPKRALNAVDKPSEKVNRVTKRPDPPNELDPQLRSRTRPRSYSSTSIDDAMKKIEEPPTPPPRPQKTHSRASSLDLNKLFQQSGQGVKSGWLPPPPALPPRPLATQVPHFAPAGELRSQNAVRQPNFADFSKFREEEEGSPDAGERTPPSQGTATSTEDIAPAKPEGSLSQPPQKPFRRKYRSDSQNLEPAPPTPNPSTPSSAPATIPSAGPTKPSQKLPSRQKKEIQTAIRKNKEANAVLTRLNSELQQQLKDIHQERITLESQLQVLRPIAFV